MQKSWFLGMICLLFSGTVLAGGFQVNLQGVSQTGMGHVGAGLAFDASAQFFNPGALAKAPRSFVLGTNPIFGRVSYLEHAPGTYNTTNEPTVSTPFSAYGSWSFEVADGVRMAAGAAVYTPFGSRVLYADDWKGQFAIREISLRAIFVQPTVAVSFLDGRLGIGGGPVFAFGSVGVRRGIPAQFNDGSYGEVALDGAGNGLGFNVGIYGEPTERLSLGLSYRSKVAFASEGGSANFTVPSSLAEFFPNTTFSSEINLPWTATLGTAYRLNGEHRLAFDVNYVGWSLYQSLDFDFADNTDKLEDSQSPRNYENAFIFRVGWQGDFIENLSLRAGTYFDMTPVPDGFTTPETPDAHKIGISTGASYTLFNQLRLDANFLWVEGMKRTDTNLEMNFGGTYKARALIPGFGLAWIFDEKKNETPQKIEIGPKG
ncbi:MAG: outer membrane protein transport protein [Bacteroidota bacterium]